MRAQRLLKSAGADTVAELTGLSKDTVLLIKKGRHKQQREAGKYVRCGTCGGLVLAAKPCHLCAVRGELPRAA